METSDWCKIKRHLDKMSFRFRGGERLQRGRGIGGILRFLRSFFTPALSKLGGAVVKAARRVRLILNNLRKREIY